MRFRTALTLACPLILLAACGDDAEVTEDDDEREATGEVLEGSISDDMLPIGQTRSQAPRLAQEDNGDTEAPEGGE